jgi:hypothetical protein
MIGISGRCSAELTSSSGLYPSPSNARARRGCTFRLRAQNGMLNPQSPRSSEALFTMRWAYLILVSRPALGFLDPRFEVPSVLSLPFPYSSA